MEAVLDFKVELNDSASAVWLKLPITCQKMITENALNALLNGKRYPRGGDQIELVIDLVDTGLDAETISTVSGLVREMVEDFMPK